MPVKPSSKEDEYIAREEYEKKKRLEEEQRSKMEAEEKSRLKELHFMHCPKCGMQLVEIDYNGIAVDKCTNCEGVFLDAGELERVAGLDKPKLDKWFSVFRKS